MIATLLFCLVGFFTSYLSLIFFIPFLRSRLLDEPNTRSSHSQPTPRGGGVSFVLVATVASTFACSAQFLFLSAPSPLLVAPLLALFLAFVGFLDDRHNLPASWRYGVQLATALAVILVSPLIVPSFALLPLMAVLVISVTALINFINFMDGLDGLVAGCMALAITAASIELVAPWPVWVLVGALLAFLLWNWSPASVFMGDVGSTFLGAVFAVFVLQSPSWSEAVSLLLVTTPLLGDACFCVLRRLLSGQHVFQAHRLHLYQRLHQAGWSHARVSSLYIFATALLSITFLVCSLPWVIGLASLVLLIGVWLDQEVAVPFVVASRN